MRVKIEFQGPGFVAVPNHVVAMVGQSLRSLGVTAERLERLGLPASLLDEAFSPLDLAALVVLAALPVGSEWSAKWVQKRLGIGRDAWQAMSRRLRAVGAIWDDVQTGEDGRHRGRCLSVRWPDDASGRKSKRRRSVGGASGWSHRKPGKPNAGKPGMGMPEKPNAGKPGIRSAQVIEIEGEGGCEVCENPPCPNTHTGDCAAAPPGQAAAQSPSPVLQTVGERGGRSQEQKAAAQALADDLLASLRAKVAAEPSRWRATVADGAASPDGLRLRRGG